MLGIGGEKMTDKLHDFETWWDESSCTKHTNGYEVIMKKKILGKKTVVGKHVERQVRAESMDDAVNKVREYLESLDD